MAERKTVNLVERPKPKKGIETKELDMKTALEIAAASLTAIGAAPKAGQTIRKIVDKGKDLLNRSKKKE